MAANTEDRLAEPPFSLDGKALDWVRKTFASLSEMERIHQLFIMWSGFVGDAGFARIKAFQPGGITAVPSPDFKAEAARHEDFRRASKVPPFITADLEGSRRSLPFGTEVPNSLALAAINDVAASRVINAISAKEARSIGINWTFTPCVDINASFRSAIVGTRSFGSDVAAITRHALAEIDVLQSNGIACTLKHFPGEGYDDRDQHLVTTVNPLSVEEGEATFGRIDRAAIAAGVLAVMPGHIAFPAFVRSVDPDAGLDAYRPATASRHLTTTLLRDRLGFNGLIVSDATGMGGLSAWSGREAAIPDLLAAGCDVILFSDDWEGDVRAISDALKSGRLEQRRVDEAVMRILGLKARLGLHQEQVAPLVPAADPADRAKAYAITARAPTLVKDTQNLLPLDPKKHRRVLIITPGVVMPLAPQPIPFAVPDMLRAEGFEVTMHTPDTEISRERFDLILYLFGDETLIARSHIYIDWLRLGGNLLKAMHRYWHDVPTAMVSFGYPYLLYDAPRVPTYINAYATIESMQRGVVEALLGRAEWNRHNPVDPFCGLEDARY